MINTPTFLKSKREIFYFLLLVASFAALFIIIYKPLGTVSIMNIMGINSLILYTATVVGFGFIVLSFSRILLYQAFKRKDRGIVFCGLWILIEVIVLGVLLTGLAFMLNDNTAIDIPSIFFRIEIDIVGILIIPTSLFSLLFIIKEKNTALTELQKQITASKSPITLQQNHVNEEPHLINFKDSAGKFAFSIASNELIYAESADNYVNIKYLKDGKLESHILHNTMKNLDEIEDNNLIRCHRYFMVNTNKVKVVKRDGSGLKLQVSGTDMEIPVSKTYLNKFIEEIRMNDIIAD